ncbi:MAG TPA: DUF4235 domain-containing protein [Propionibacteriaceae bacterium]|nr:DUF4235 domain-containing protein [Propionibacteriaceae bacterium]
MGNLGKIAYKPVGIGGSLLAASAASAVVRQIWRSLGHQDEAPGPLEAESSLKKVLLAAAIQGVVFGVVRALIERGGAKLFEKLTGEWPGN